MTKDVTKRTEYIVYVLVVSTTGAISLHTGMTKLVVTRPLLIIRKNRVSVGGLLEFFFGLLVSRVTIRMVMQRLFAIGLLYIGR